MDLQTLHFFCTAATEGEKFTNNYRIRTLHVEDLFEVLYLTGADAASGATPVAFTAPEK